jgi:hypothetical protein
MATGDTGKNGVNVLAVVAVVFKKHFAIAIVPGGNF